jgi:DNA-binding response OmpR family regulator
MVMAGTWSLRQLFARNAVDRVQNAEPIGPSTDRIEIGDFILDTAHRSVTLCGKELPLTSEEFDVFLYLTGHPQRFVTPRTVLATSWNRRSLPQTEFLKVLLGLRRKIEALFPGKPYLRTEPWVVYRFDPSPSLET